MKVHFESNSIQLCGIVENPTGSKDAPIIVLLHGFVSKKDNKTNTQIVPILTKNSISTFRFDFFGHEESGGDFAEITPSIGVQNALDAIAYLRKEGYTNIGLMGSSFGGYVGYMVGSQEELSVLALKCPVADFGAITDDMTDVSPEEWKEKGSTSCFGRELNYTFKEDADTSSAYSSMTTITAPTILVHGDADPIVPIEQSKKAAERIPHCMLAVVDGADHQFSEHFDTMITLLTNFIIEKVNE